MSKRKRKKKNRNQDDTTCKVVILITALIQLIGALVDLIDKLT